MRWGPSARLPLASALNTELSMPIKCARLQRKRAKERAPTCCLCVHSRSMRRQAKALKSSNRPMNPAGPSPLRRRKLGRLRVLLVRMNPDLAMGAELLKKTGVGNLFMVFGEPDVEMRRSEDNQ